MCLCPARPASQANPTRRFLIGPSTSTVPTDGLKSITAKRGRPHRSRGPRILRYHLWPCHHSAVGRFYRLYRDLTIDSVTTGKIVDANVTSAKLANNAVTNTKLADNAVTALELAVNVVTETKVTDSAVTNAKLAGSITYDKLAGSIPYANLSLPDGDIPAVKLAGIIPYSKLSLALGEVPADRIGTIPASQLTVNSITASQIASSTVTSDELARDSVVAIKIAAEQVTSVKLAKRAMSTVLYPNFPKSSLRVEDPTTCTLGVRMMCGQLLASLAPGAAMSSQLLQPRPTLATLE